MAEFLGAGARATVSAIRHSCCGGGCRGRAGGRELVGDEPVATESIPRFVRIGIRVFLTLFILTGVFEIQAWPLTGWRLFSQTRSDESVALAAVVVDRTGHSHPLRGGTVPALARSFGAQRLAASVGEPGASDQLSEYAWLLLDQARIVEGEQLPDPPAFARRLALLLERGLAQAA